MSEHQFIVSLFDKKFIPEKIIDKYDHNISSSGTTSSNPLSSQINNNNILFVNNNLQQQQQQQRLLLSGKQFWPTSKPIRYDYIITSNDSTFDNTFSSNLLSTSTNPIKKFFNKIWNKMNPNEILKRKFSLSNSSPQENCEDYHLNQHYSYHNEYLKTHKKTSYFPNTSSLTREKPIREEQSKNILKKRIPSIHFCYDDMFNRRNPISSPINPVAISRNQSISYAPRHNLNPLLSPDERTSKPLQTVCFNIHIYCQNWPIKYQIELPRNISFHRFKCVISQMLHYEIPDDFIVLYHTKRYTNDDFVIRSGINNEKINWFLLDYLCKSDKIRVVTHDAIWSIYLLMWNDDEISVTLFSRSLIEN
ncbi:hypothetical protein C1645_735512 [Glomus cerebriforme]|uniref:Uncharacterized protein n=1 Tax=Glomus cerebriforme TaxID=658196 RepID=A0A397T5E0_9GLOM|nr:hypothetical protein C1645_735512 [Glomus cerebriforme]